MGLAQFKGPLWLLLLAHPTHPISTEGNPQIPSAGAQCLHSLSLASCCPDIFGASSQASPLPDPPDHVRLLFKFLWHLCSSARWPYHTVCWCLFTGCLTSVCELFEDKTWRICLWAPSKQCGTWHRGGAQRADGSSKQFNSEVLKAHNEYRQQHGVPPLKLCKKLNQEAQQYSEALASTRILKHSPESSRGQCGENLAWASYDQTGKEVADRWYSEIKNYNFQQPGFNSGTGHFTAMVWKNTKKMGVGKASASDGSSFVVARYFPAGNVVNQGFFEENVLPPKK
ncbi:Golgi-associated plant pathogenesis-related protein 1 [Pteropus alecto]|uniref:Golgi-associated plant pathogenesis-related protein 1 n=1 Tax=Pteropus alecto TaxID=9402 RepID=L5KNW2_PTEAL|nr:Golgi-associated plant pathogenesis-related protein 1 [Pteropus alecto]